MISTGFPQGDLLTKRHGSGNQCYGLLARLSRNFSSERAGEAETQDVSAGAVVARRRAGGNQISCACGRPRNLSGRRPVCVLCHRKSLNWRRKVAA